MSQTGTRRELFENLILKQVEMACALQDEKHGSRSISSAGINDFEAVTILTEEVGEVARAFIEGDREQALMELFQVAACAVGRIELLLTDGLIDFVEELPHDGAALRRWQDEKVSTS